MATLNIGADLKNYIVNLIKSTVRDVYYPIGRTYITMGSEDPNKTIGGTWELIAKGRTLVGVDENDVDFNEVGKTGGSKYLQNHFHKFNRPAIYASENKNDGSVYSAYKYKTSSIYSQDTTKPNVTTGNSGNLQPYLTCYIWQRTA